MARKDLVDGSKAYKDRKFPEAERLFRSAASRDPEGNTLEGRTAQLSLARTLHSMYIGDRLHKELAQQALAEYKKSLPQSLKDLADTKAAYDKSPNSTSEQARYLGSLNAVDSSTSAIASLNENLEQPDAAKEWLTSVAGDAKYPETARARSLSSLSGKLNTCANDITDTEQTKKTVKKDGKDTFQFVKPQKPEDFTKLKECVDQGVKLIDQAAALEPDLVKNATKLDLKAASDVQLALYSEILKSFESVRSYRASLLIQAMRAAEMDGKTADADKLKTDSEAAKNAFKELSDVVRKIQTEIDDRTAAKAEAEKGAAANANKK
ncbi:MAG: hypothetical protein ABI999_15450 [Acidobacteriota bacterium]